MSLGHYQSRPSAYFHRLYGKERESELMQAAKDVIDQPIKLAACILKQWAKKHSSIIEIRDFTSDKYWKISDLAKSIEVVDQKLIFTALSDLQENYCLPTILPSGLTFLDYTIENFDHLSEILSIVNPFWLLEMHACAFKINIATGSYAATDEDMKYIRSWLIKEFSIDLEGLNTLASIKSLSYPVDRREDGEPRNVWLNRQV